MLDEAHVTEMALDRRLVLMMQRSASARMVMPVVGEVKADCLVLLYAGVRTALGAEATGESVAVAVPDENIVVHLESLVNAARTWFPELAGGLRLEHRDTLTGAGAVGGQGGPWIKLSHCGDGIYGVDDVVTHACCPSYICKDMVPLLDGGVFAEHTSRMGLAGVEPCGWSGVRVVDDRADWTAPPEDTAVTRSGHRPWRRRQ